MLITDHLAPPADFYRFRAPPGGNAGGRTIQPGCEDIEIIIDGEGFFDWEKKTHTVRAGAVLWHLPGEVTIYRSNPSFPYECVVARFPVAGAPRRQIPKITAWTDPGELRQFALELLGAYHRDDTDRALLTRYAYTRLLWKAHEFTLRRPDAAQPRGVRLALGYLEAHFAGSLHVDDLAVAAGLSAAHLHALFKKHLGRPPHQVLLQRRLQEARNLLATTDRQVKDICFACGFRDVVNFCRCFKARFGTTPARFRVINCTPPRPPAVRRAGAAPAAVPTPPPECIPPAFECR